MVHDWDVSFYSMSGTHQAFFFIAAFVHVKYGCLFQFSVSPFGPCTSAHVYQCLQTGGSLPSQSVDPLFTYTVVTNCTPIFLSFSVPCQLMFATGHSVSIFVRSLLYSDGYSGASTQAPWEVHVFHGLLKWVPTMLPHFILSSNRFDCGGL